MPPALPPARRPLSVLAGKVAEALLDQALPTVADAVDYTTDPPDWVANGSPSSVVGRLSQGAARAACRQWANGAVDPQARSTQRQYASMCGPYLEGLGASIGPDSNQSPFTGGQCQFEYRVSGTVQRTREDGTVDSFPFDRGCGASLDSIFGPVSTAIVSVPQGPVEVPQARILHRDAAGNPDFTSPFQGGETDTLVFSGVNPVPCDPGNADDCGDPPPEYSPPVVTNPPAPGSPDVVVNTPAGPEGTRVTVNPDGSITVQPLDENGQPIGPPGTFNRPVGEGQAGDPEETDPGSDDSDGELSGEAPPGQVMLGVVVEVLEKFSGARVETGPVPLTYSGGWVSFGRDGGEELCWFRISHPSQLFSPQVIDATSWRVKKSPHWRLKVTPIYREPERE